MCKGGEEKDVRRSLGDLAEGSLGQGEPDGARWGGGCPEPHVPSNA